MADCTDALRRNAKEYFARPIMTGPHARCEMSTVTFLVSINLAHSDITIDVSTQKSLLEDVTF